MDVWESGVALVNRRLMALGFCLHACCAGLDIFLYKFMESRPSVIPADEINCLVLDDRKECGHAYCGERRVEGRLHRKHRLDYHVGRIHWE